MFLCPAKTFDFTALNGAEKIVNTIRVVELDGQPWFVAKGACAIFDHKNPSMIIKHLDASEKGLSSTYTPGGTQRLTAVTESGLYKLIMRSKKPVAKQFRNWVAKSVLPAIHKDGGYISGEEKVSTGGMTEGELIFKAVGILQAKVERLTVENAVMLKELNLLIVDELTDVFDEFPWARSNIWPEPG